MTTFRFEEALRLLRLGECVSQSKWKKSGTFLFLPKEGSVKPCDRRIYCAIDGQPGFGLWVPSGFDIVGSDWFHVRPSVPPVGPKPPAPPKQKRAPQRRSRGNDDVVLIE